MKLNQPGSYETLFIPVLCEAVEDSDRGGKRLRVKGKIQQVDKVNENNRAYPKKLWDKVLSENSSFMKRLKTRQVLGVLEHPEKGGTKLGEVSHLIEDVWMENGDVKGSILILKTPSGAILEELFSVKSPVGVSSRANGDVKKRSDGVEEVLDEGFDLETFDFVYKPSVSDAQPIPVTESADGKNTKSEGKKMDLKESVTKIRDAADLVREAQKPGMTVVQLVETAGKLQALDHELTSVAADCAGEANVVRGQISMVLPAVRASLDRQMVESKTTPVAGEKTQAVSADIVRKLLVQRKQMAERIALLERELTQASAQQRKDLGEYKEHATGIVEGLLDDKGKLETGTKSLSEDKARAVETVATLLAQKDRAVTVIEGLLNDKDRAVDIVTEMLDIKDRAIDVVERLLDDKDRAINVVEGLLDKKDRATRIVEGLLDKLDEKEAKLANLYQVLRAVVEKARVLQRNAYLGKLFHDNPSLKQHKDKFEKCSTVVECQELVRKMGVSVNESRTGHDGNVATRRPSHIPVEGIKPTIVETTKGERKGFIHLVAKQAAR